LVPTAFSPTAFSPTAFSPILVFSSAVPQSIIGVSSFAGNVPRGLMLSTWNSSENWYVAVIGHDRAFSVAAPFNLSVAVIEGDCTPVTAALPASTTDPVSQDYRTIIVTDLSRIVGTSSDKYASCRS
jgi:hypothetical protein